MKYAAMGLLLVLCVGCVSITPQEMSEYYAMVAAGEPVAHHPNAYLAGFMSLLIPGGGQFYCGEIVPGIIDALLWPLSVCWAVPAARHDAVALQMRRSVRLKRSRSK